MPCCSVFLCKKRSNTSSIEKDNVTFHLFPKVPVIRDAWMKACAKHVSWTPKRTSTICSQHFEPSCFIIQAHNKRKLKECAVPTLKLPKVERSEESTPGTFIHIKIETVENSLPPTQECIMIKDQPHMSQSENHNPHLCDSPKTIKLRKIILMKNKKIKRLQSQIRYLKKKVDEMQEVFNELTEKSIINKENRLAQDKNGVEEKEKSTPILE
ncbi:THAP domain-containing protein 1-like [Cydia fagiglandana]|uniref:THAP domain-containing protein 1-like n=1 Tax=Cydia fagiglandana TaxID=1458189 RepID=UPI002FEE2C10